MLKKYLFLILFASLFTNAQNKRFIYEYSYILDSTNKADVKKELLVLDVNPDGSKFYSYEKFKSDSLLNVEIEKQKNSDSDIINFNPTYKGKIIYTVSKNYPDFKTFLHIGLGADDYKVSDDRKMIWEILPEKQKIGEFEVQKAESEMFGRKWIAWFTTEIPIQDGPYKFNGLPGLIAKIEDQNKTHTFELKGVSKMIDNELKVKKQTFDGKEVPINHSQYKKMYLELRNDPAKTLREMMNSAAENFKMFDPSGAEIKPADVLRKRELQGIENRKKNNNVLELDLLK